MKKTILLLLLGLFIFQHSAIAVAPNAPKNMEVIIAAEKTAVQQKKERKIERRKAKLEKRIEKFKKKIAKKGKATGTGVWDDDTFRLGAMIALGGLLLRLLAFIPLLGGILSLIGFIILILGLGIMIWVLIKD